MGLVQEFGSVWLFFIRVMRVFATTRGHLRPVIAQVASISIRSLSTVIFAGIFVGAILVLQMDLILSKYDAGVFLGGLNTSTIVREVGPLIISFLLAGKIGAFTAAELGTMRVTEQIDAIECLGTNPIEYLIVPRVLGIILSSLLLLGIGVLVSIVGSMAVAQALCGMNFLEFAGSIPQFTNGWTLLGAAFKSCIYGTIVGTVACHKGYSASGGARGVGRAVTQAAIFTNFYIVLANFCTSHFLDFLWDLFESVHGVAP